MLIQCGRCLLCCTGLRLPRLQVNATFHAVFFVFEITSMETIEKQELTSLNITEHQREKLKTLFPEVFTEGEKIDWDKLQLTLGESIDVGKERFGMNWAGKSDCYKTIQQPSIATLLPACDESVDFDTTQNLFIEGDNLEVLKLLQKSYLGKVKMIYIDPPYNTGNDFIYPDDYKQSLQNYLEYSGQTDNGGRSFSTNKDTNGRFHSDWLNMMYPRLFLAKNLLREDGVIFISIDDNEVHNLRALFNEVFGEENFVGQVTICGNPRGRDYGGIARMHDYLLVYCKNLLDVVIQNIPDDNKEFPFTDERGGFELRELRNRNIAFNSENRPNLYYPFYINTKSVDINGLFEISLFKIDGWVELYPKVSQGYKTVWRWGKERSTKYLNTEIKAKSMMDGGFQIVEKYRESSRMARSIWADKDVNTEKGTLLVKELFENKVFSFPKPIGLIKRCLQMGSFEDSIILDFFAGSATTAHAVLDLNKEDGGNRKFICVQIPEPTDEASEAHKAGYKTIAEISKERIRRVINKIKTEHQNNSDMFKADISEMDLGFKVFKLAASNFNVWDSNIDKPEENIATQLEMFVEHINPQSSQEDILYELILKSGKSITQPIDKLDMEGKTVYSIENGDLLVCLEENLTQELLRAIAEHQPNRVICLDKAFAGENADALKTNAVQIMKSKGITNFRTV